MLFRLKGALHAEELKKLGVRQSQLPLLAVLADTTQPLSQEQMAELLVLDKAAVARGVSQLEEQGYLVREINEQNRRQKLVSLTETGQKLGERLCDVLRKSANLLLQDFSSEEKDLLVKLMDKAVARGRMEKYGRVIEEMELNDVHNI